MLMVPSPSLSATLTRRFISSSDSLSPRPRMISASSDGVTFATTTTTTTTATASHDKRAQKTPYFVYFHLVGTSRKNTNHATCTHKRRLTRDHARNLRIAGGPTYGSPARDYIPSRQPRTISRPHFSCKFPLALTYTGYQRGTERPGHRRANVGEQCQNRKHCVPRT